jgi:transcriptional regulator with XRE-family HTH domain
MSFGSNLRSARENKELSQEQMAQLIPMNQSNYSKIERDLQEPNLYQLKKISEILEISTDILLEVDIKGNDKKDMYILEEMKNMLDEYLKK